MRRQFAVLIVCVLGALGTMGDSCGIQIIEGSGIGATVERDVAAFDRVANSTMIDMLVVAGAAPHVKLTCDDNLLDHFCVVVEGGSLRLETADGSPTNLVALQPKTHCLAEVTAAGPVRGLSNTGSAELIADAPLVEQASIAATGSGNVEAKAIAAVELQVSLTGSGDVMLGGTSDVLQLTLTGSGNVQARDLVVQSARVDVTGSGNAALMVEECVDVTITGSGNVCVAGRPEVCGLSTPGSGRVSFE